MRIPCTGDIRRLVGLMALASALALILFGGLAVPAAAQTRQQAVQQANDAIDGCFDTGGEPDAATGSDGSIAVTCEYPSGSGNTSLYCRWMPGAGYKLQCDLVAGADAHAPIGGGVLDGAALRRDAPASHGHHMRHKGKGGRR